MFKFLNIKNYHNFYGAIFIAFFFNFTYSYDESTFIKGIWIKKDQLQNEQSIKEVISNAYRSGYKIIFLQIDVHNNYHYNPLIERNYNKPNFDPLNTALYWANLYDIQIHVWINAYKIWSSKWSPPENHIFYKLQKDYKSWFATDINGRSDYNFDLISNSDNFSGIFLSPLNPSVNIYIENIIEKILFDYKGKIHGIHLDYFRYKDSMYGYNIYGRKKFFDVYDIDPIYLNKNINNNNIELSDSIHIIKEQWLKYKGNQIDSLVVGLRNLISNFNEMKSKNIKLSVAVKPEIYEAKLRWNQNWDYWLNNDFIDYVILMNYYNDTESFSNNLWNIYKYFYNSKNLNKILVGVNTIENNLGNLSLKDVTIIREQVENVRDFSYPGVVIFSSEYFKFNPTLYLEIFSEKDKN